MIIKPHQPSKGENNKVSTTQSVKTLNTYRAINERIYGYTYGHACTQKDELTMGLANR